MLNTKRHGVLLLLLTVSPFFAGSVMTRQAAPGSGTSWTPPIGIPAPAFGLTQTHMMYVGQVYAYSTGSAQYNDAGNGPYTHYVDSSVACSDAGGNNYGTAASPRCTMPNAFYVAAGAVIEVHSAANVNQISMIYVGTAAAPIFVRGANASTKGVFANAGLLIRGQYVIYENLAANNAWFDVRSVAENVHHIAIRHSYVYNGARMSVGGGTNASYLVSQVVIYGNQIYTDNFDLEGGEFPEKDAVGVYSAMRSEDVWVVDNDIRGQSGDAVGGGHAVNYTAKRWYIGRNLLHDTGENGIDLKEVENFVVSQNKIYNFKGLSSGSDGTAVVIHYGPKLSPKNTWFLFNEIYNATDKGIQVGGDQILESYFVGNVVHNIRNAKGTGKAFMTWNSCKINLIGNTFANNDSGITASGTAGCGKLVLKNNIIANLQASGGNSINSMSDTGYTSNAEITHNLVYPGPSAGVSCKSCRTAPPLFVDPAKNDFRLQPGSPGIDAADSSVMESFAATFKSAFGLDIFKDADGKTRTIGRVDIGAFEVGGTAPLTAPTGAPGAPTGLRISGS